MLFNEPTSLATFVFRETSGIFFFSRFANKHMVKNSTYFGNKLILPLVPTTNINNRINLLKVHGVKKNEFVKKFNYAVKIN